MHQQKLELIALTKNEALGEIRKINLIEMQLEQALKFNKRNIIKTDIQSIKRFKGKGYSHEEIGIVFNLSAETIRRYDKEYQYKLSDNGNLHKIEIEY